MKELVASFRETWRNSGAVWTLSKMMSRIGLPLVRLWPEKKVPAEILAVQLNAILLGFNMPEDHAKIVSHYLMYADLHGIESHGCSMLLKYDRELKQTKWNPNPRIELIQESETTALVDGGGGLGHIPADFAMKIAVSKCERIGIGAVAVRNSGHFGAAGAYAALAAQAGFIGVALTNTEVPAIVPTFGLQAVLGTNPIAFCAPAAIQPPFHLDMATSTVPLGKIGMVDHQGGKLPEGWALDADGSALTNPRAALKARRLTPLGSSAEMGSHKGYGLAAMVEILTSVLSGSRSGDCKKTAHFFLALDPARFRAKGEFESDLDSLIESLRNCKPVHRKQPVMVAGDPERKAFAANNKSGVTLTKSVMEDLRSICKSRKIPYFLD